MSIETATHFWIEAGEMSGGSRNQIEFSDELASFFDAKSRSENKVFIAYNSAIKAYCPFADRGQGYDQWTNIWRLSLITKDKGGDDYQGRVICFEKKAVGKTHVYLIKVTDRNSLEHNAWVSSSTSRGVTGGAEGRDYGYW